MKIKFIFVIVTHNSSNYIRQCIKSIREQQLINYQIIIIDSGSSDTSYLNIFNENKDIKIFYEKNIGFCKANNLAIKYIIKKSEFIILLNPDIFIIPNIINPLIDNTFKQVNEPDKIGAITCKLLRYNNDKNEPTKIIDSFGIFRKWYGKWYDRGQNEVDEGQFDSLVPEVISAFCGAFVIIKSEILEKVKISENQYFNNSLFMYKDDIELSLRIREYGYKIYFNSNFIVYHCRGWQKREKMPKWSKIISAKNEIIINKKIGVVPLLYSTLKLFLAKLNL